jgi:hypothetical protein
MAVSSTSKWRHLLFIFQPPTGEVPVSKKWFIWMYLLQCKGFYLPDVTSCPLFAGPTQPHIMFPGHLGRASLVLFTPTEDVLMFKEDQDGNK